MLWDRGFVLLCKHACRLCLRDRRLRGGRGLPPPVICLNRPKMLSRQLLSKAIDSSVNRRTRAVTLFPDLKFSISLHELYLGGLICVVCVQLVAL